MIFNSRNTRHSLLIEVNPYQILAAAIDRPDGGPCVIESAVEFDASDDAGLRLWLDENFDKAKSWIPCIGGFAPPEALLQRESIQARRLIEADYLPDLVKEQYKIENPAGWKFATMTPPLSSLKPKPPYWTSWPKRAPLPVARLDLAAIGTMTFRDPDLIRYPALRLAREVMAVRGLAGAAFNAAKEVALDMFIAGRIGFMDMAGLVETTLARVSAETSLGKAATTLEDVTRRNAGESCRSKVFLGPPSTSRTFLHPLSFSPSSLLFLLLFLLLF